MTLDKYFGDVCPAPQLLRTGDLVFPRRAEPAEPDASPEWRSNYPDKKFSELILSQFPLLYGVIQTQLASKGKADLLGNHSPSLLPQGAPGMQLARPSSHSSEHGSEKKREFDLDDPEVQMFLYKVINLAFRDLLGHWFEMTPDKFIKSDLGKFLLKALTANDPRDSFFVGHLAMIIREQDGNVVQGNEGRPFVIEANTTDFSHYRVAVHSYVADDELGQPLPSSRLARGWATRRLAEGEKIWAARPMALPPGDQADIETQSLLKSRLAAEAKAFHGRPFGLFDNSTFGDTDRMYCAEFLHNVFRRASSDSISIADRLSWGWVVKYLEASHQGEVKGLVENLMKSNGFENKRPFFVLTPPMIWSSAAMRHVFTPLGEGPYSPAVP